MKAQGGYPANRRRASTGFTPALDNIRGPQKPFKLKGVPGLKPTNSPMNYKNPKYKPSNGKGVGF